MKPISFIKDYDIKRFALTNLKSYEFKTDAGQTINYTRVFSCYDGKSRQDASLGKVRVKFTDLSGKYSVQIYLEGDTGKRIAAKIQKLHLYSADLLKPFCNKLKIKMSGEALVQSGMYKCPVFVHANDDGTPKKDAPMIMFGRIFESTFIRYLAGVDEKKNKPIFKDIKTVAPLLGKEFEAVVTVIFSNVCKTATMSLQCSALNIVLLKPLSAPADMSDEESILNLVSLGADAISVMALEMSKTLNLEEVSSPDPATGLDNFLDGKSTELSSEGSI